MAVVHRISQAGETYVFGRTAFNGEGTIADDSGSAGAEHDFHLGRMDVMEPETESSTKFLSVGELRGLGILQEANRLLFHPLGLALEVDLEAGTLRIQDHRSDPEGVIYGEGVLDPGNTARFKCFQNKRHELREKTLGYVIQAVAGVPDGSATPD